MFLTSFPAGPLQANCYVWSADDAHAVVVDPGVNAADGVHGILTEQGLTLDAVLLTHGHPDHVGAAADVADRHGVPAYLHAADAPMLDPATLPDWAREIVERFGVNHTAPADLRLLAGGETVDAAGARFTTVAAPGHTPGSLLWRVELPERFAQAPELTELVFTGDVVFAGAIGRTDLPGGDHATMLTTLADVVLALPDTAALLPGHGPETTLAHERATNPFLRSH
ncbi:MBL fold metallo-hydrolase [Propioniciclava soli]|uniref:MBL fold metallo-hydrolase n=1 Tax=Propioniciclava soli TaxID=2775081 RepID=UPI001E3AB066|nr:MBL fold metallo-hydrolase [Propioniciclava soli]